MNARERALAGATAAVLGVAGLYTLLLEPAWTRWSEAAAKVRVLEGALARERAQVEGLERVRAERAALEERLRAAGSDTAFVDHTQALAREAGFQPSIVRFVAARPVAAAAKARGAREEAPAFAELSFELRARTSQEKLTDFLVRLAASDRPVRVAALDVTPRVGSGDVDVDLALLALAPTDVLDAKAAGRPR